MTGFYGYDREITLRHLSILWKPTFIKIRPKRYRCPSCQDRPKTTQKLEGYQPRSSHKKAYETPILLSLVDIAILYSLFIIFIQPSNNFRNKIIKIQ